MCGDPKAPLARLITVWYHINLKFRVCLQPVSAQESSRAAASELAWARHCLCPNTTHFEQPSNAHRREGILAQKGCAPRENDQGGRWKSHDRGKVHTLRLVVPCKKKRNVDGAVTRKKVLLTAGDLVSFGKLPGTYFANLAGETSRYITKIELQNKGARTVHKDVRGGAYFHGKQPRNRETER